MEKKFKRDVNSLQEVFTFIESFIEAIKLDKSFTFSLNLVAEELFINMVKYNSENPNNISISLKKANNDLILKFMDYDVEPFDITQTEDYDPKKPLQERQIGGLGIPFIKKMVDKILYEYENRCSTITLIKHLRKANV